MPELLILERGDSSPLFVRFGNRRQLPLSGPLGYDYWSQL